MSKMYLLKNKLITCHYALMRGNRYVCRMTGEMYLRRSDMRCSSQNECAALFCRREFRNSPVNLIPNYAPINNQEDFTGRTMEASGRRTFSHGEENND